MIHILIYLLIFQNLIAWKLFRSSVEISYSLSNAKTQQYDLINSVKIHNVELIVDPRDLEEKQYWNIGKS